MHVVLNKATVQDIPKLQELCRLVYTHYFGDHWTGNGLADYLQNQFGNVRLISDLSDQSIGFYFIHAGSRRVGFLKVKHDLSLGQFEPNTCSEIEKLYILPEWTSKGIGRTSMELLLNSLENHTVKHVFLDVLASNHKALEFYKKQGFAFYEYHRLSAPNFKDELRDMQRLIRSLR